ncbi:MAG: 23S rRNA (adenine(2030)-N(6))-methyltransferase RlmJ [Pseudomonadota bacterium]
MLSYRHAYHAGNHGDILKHSVLALLMQALTRKDTPFCYLETHAGVGRYDLRAPEAQKTDEWRDGIARLWQRDDVPAQVTPYLDAVRDLNPDGRLHYYPGSPRIARHFARAHDRLVLCELHGSDVPLLKQEFAGDRQVAVHHQDGYQGLKAFLPPKEKRGLVLIDPSYEVKSEFDQVTTALGHAHARWPTGLYALWYPILNRPSIERLHRRMKESGIRKQLYVELCIAPDDGGPMHIGGMHGSGMLLINPPWQLDEQLKALLPWLHQCLDHAGHGRWTVAWLVGE